MKTVINLRIGKQRIFIGKGVKQLLDAIDHCRSIKKACEATGISYTKATRMINILESETNQKIVISKKGGKEYGGTCLTQEGKNILEIYTQISDKVDQYAQKLVDTEFDFLNTTH